MMAVAEPAKDDGCPFCSGAQCDIWEALTPADKQFAEEVELPEWNKWNKDVKETQV